MLGFSGNSGTFAGITNAFSYNKRLQPLNMSATFGSPLQTVFSIGYDLHLGNGTSGSDNGNVWGITNNKDTTRNQTFTYDPLNRLISAENAGTDSNNYKFTYKKRDTETGLAFAARGPQARGRGFARIFSLIRSPRASTLPREARGGDPDWSPGLKRAVPPPQFSTFFLTP
jgi:hypothetical protein